MIRNSIIFLTLIFLATQGYSQVNGDIIVPDEDRDAFYMYYMKAASDQAPAYQKAQAKLSLPPLELGELTLYNTLGLDVHHFNYAQTQPEFASQLNKFYNINYSLLLRYSLSTNWAINALAMPHILSSLGGKLNSDDVKLNGMLFAEKNFSRKGAKGYYRLMFGVGYLTMAGQTNVTPVLNFMAKVNRKLSFVVGLPNTYIKYNFNKKHSLKLLGDLNDFSANINMLVYTDQPSATKVDRAVFTTVSAGFEYNYWFAKNWGLMLRGLYSLHDNYELQDGNQRRLYSFNTKQKPYLLLGLKFNMLR